MANTVQTTHKDRAQPASLESTRGGPVFTPRVDIYETEEELVLLADLPGVLPGDVDLRYEKGELLLHGRAKPRHEGKTGVLREYGEGDFYRVFTIHESIDSSRIKAEFTSGVLTVHLPKAEAARPRQIQVRAE
jgi:HSP20 family protein